MAHCFLNRSLTYIVYSHIHVFEGFFIYFRVATVEDLDQRYVLMPAQVLYIQLDSLRHMQGCSTTHRCIKRAARSINAILLPTVLYFPCSGNYLTVMEILVMW